VGRGGVLRGACSVWAAIKALASHQLKRQKLGLVVTVGLLTADWASRLRPEGLSPKD